MNVLLVNKAAIQKQLVKRQMESLPVNANPSTLGMDLTAQVNTLYFFLKVESRIQVIY